MGKRKSSKGKREGERGKGEEKMNELRIKIEKTGSER